jgi:hypothetical protein
MSSSPSPAVQWSALRNRVTVAPRLEAQAVPQKAIPAASPESVCLPGSLCFPSSTAQKQTILRRHRPQRRSHGPHRPDRCPPRAVASLLLSSSHRRVSPVTAGLKKACSPHRRNWAVRARAGSRAAPAQFFQFARRGLGRAWNVVSSVYWRINTRLRGSYTGHAYVAITVQTAAHARLRC